MHPGNLNISGSLMGRGPGRSPPWTVLYVLNQAPSLGRGFTPWLRLYLHEPHSLDYDWPWLLRPLPLGKLPWPSNPGPLSCRPSHCSGIIYHLVHTPYPKKKPNLVFLSSLKDYASCMMSASQPQTIVFSVFPSNSNKVDGFFSPR